MVRKKQSKVSAARKPTDAIWRSCGLSGIGAQLWRVWQRNNLAIMQKAGHPRMKCIILSFGAITDIAPAQPALIVTPSGGELGTVVQLSVSPQTPGYELNSETTGIWFGSYSSSGGTSPLFTTTYSGADITILDAWTAQVVLGSGETVSKSGDIDSTVTAMLAPNGTLNGSFQLITPNPCVADFNSDGSLNFFDISAFLVAYSSGDLAADITGNDTLDFFDVSAFLVAFNQGCGDTMIEVNGTVALGFTAEAAKWHTMYYPGGWSAGTDADLISEVSGDLNIFPVSTLPSVPSDDSILSASGSIYAVTLDVESNMLTDAGQPASISVDIFTVDAQGDEVDRIRGVELLHEGILGGRVRYSTQNAKNIMLTDSFLDDAGYTHLRTIEASDNGTAFVVISIGE